MTKQEPANCYLLFFGTFGSNQNTDSKQLYCEVFSRIELSKCKCNTCMLWSFKRNVTIFFCEFIVEKQKTRHVNQRPIPQVILVLSEILLRNERYVFGLRRTQS